MNTCQRVDITAFSKRKISYNKIRKTMIYINLYVHLLTCWFNIKLCSYSSSIFDLSSSKFVFIIYSVVLIEQKYIEPSLQPIITVPVWCWYSIIFMFASFIYGHLLSDQTHQSSFTFHLHKISNTPPCWIHNFEITIYNCLNNIWLDISNIITKMITINNKWVIY